MIRHNRLKKIIEAMGHKIHTRYQPINQKTLDRLGLSQFRIVEILENKPNKPDMTIAEIDSICEWLGISPGDLLVPKGKEKVEELVQVKMQTTVSIYTPGSQLKKRPDLFSVNA